MARLAFLALFIPLATLAGTAAASAQVSANAQYIVTLGGINIARVSVDLDDDNRRYSLDASAEVAGLGSFVARGNASASAEGTISGNDLNSQHFELATRAGGETFDVSVDYAGGGVTAFKVEPPIPDYDRVPLERRHLTGVQDMLSAFVIRAPALSADVCQQNLRIFTGIERFDVAMRFARTEEATSPRTGYQGPVVLCTLDYRPISGHFENSEITSYLADTDRILLWYAPLGETGYFVPYRALIGTGAGDLSMVLTSLTN
ncbi:hypothetical protein GCM10007989_23000 [Devosia pacifica]|uniref:DUF3108 domain-containing protein n=1 Tax=Devosia pacifica TaxID=1335967 RepID=A0A918VVF7_9HYPH|nr:DUF3108 domain-containing protein [Devosia pacifica]GHA26606.1 hypothetical protein GCM10007989_23000 [Devosia pacifica]